MVRFHAAPAPAGLPTPSDVENYKGHHKKREICYILRQHDVVTEGTASLNSLKIKYQLWYEGILPVNYVLTTDQGKKYEGWNNTQLRALCKQHGKYDRGEDWELKLRLHCHDMRITKRSTTNVPFVELYDTADAQEVRLDHAHDVQVTEFKGIPPANNQGANSAATPDIQDAHDQGHQSSTTLHANVKPPHALRQIFHHVFGLIIATCDLTWRMFLGLIRPMPWYVGGLPSFMYLIALAITVWMIILIGPVWNFLHTMVSRVGEWFLCVFGIGMAAAWEYARNAVCRRVCPRKGLKCVGRLIDENGVEIL
jgi:hypothetical protein